MHATHVKTKDKSSISTILDFAKRCRETDRMLGPSVVSQVCSELVGVGGSMQAKIDRR